MDPNLFLLPRLKEDSESGREGNTEESQSMLEELGMEVIERAKEALSECQSQFPSDSPESLTRLSFLIQTSLSSAQSLLSQNQLQAAHQLLQLYDSALAPLPPHILPAERCDLYNTLSYICRMRNKPNLSHKFAIKALNILHSSDSPDIDRSGTHLNLYGVLSLMGRFKEGVDHAKLSVETLQEDLVTMKLTHRTENLREKVRLLVAGYGHVAAGLEAQSLFQEAAGWYRKAVRLAAESQDEQLTSLLPTLQSSLTAVRARGGTESMASYLSQLNSSQSSHSSLQSSAFRMSSKPLSRPASYKRSPKSDLSSSSYKTENMSGIGQLSEGDEELRALRTMGVMDFQESGRIATMSDEKSNKSGEHLKLRIPLKEERGKETSPKIHNFLWKRGTSESEKSDFSDRDAPRLPKLLDQSRSSQSSSHKSPVSSQKSSASSSKSREEKQRSPMRLERTYTGNSRKSSESGKQRPQPILRNVEKQPVTKDYSPIISAIKIRIARNIRKSLQIAASQKLEIALESAALRIQCIFRRFQAQLHTKMLQKSRNSRKLLLRTSRKFDTDLATVSVFEAGEGNIEFEVRIQGKEWKTTAKLEGKEEIRAMVARLSIEEGKELVLKTEETRKSLSDFWLLYAENRYKVTIIHSQGGIEVTCLPASPETHLLLSGFSSTHTSFHPIYPDNLPLSLTVIGNTIQLRSFPASYQYQRQIWEGNVCDVRLYSRDKSVEAQIEMGRDRIALLEIGESEAGVEIGKIGEREWRKVAESIDVKKNGFPFFHTQIPASPRSTLAAQLLQSAIRRYLARKKVALLRKYRNRSKFSTLLCRKSVKKEDFYLNLTIFSQNFGYLCIVAVDCHSKTESKVKIPPKIWQKFGCEQIDAVDGVVSGLIYREGRLSCIQMEESGKKSTKKPPSDQTIVTIQRSIRGFLGRRRYQKLNKTRKWLLKLCKGRDFSNDFHFLAIYVNDNSIRIEVFPTYKDSPVKVFSLCSVFSLVDLHSRYENIPSFQVLYEDVEVGEGEIRINHRKKEREIVIRPDFVMETPKRTASGFVTISIFRYECEESYLEFRPDSSSSTCTKASISSLSHHFHIPTDQLFTLSLLSVYYLLEIRGDTITLNFNKPIPDFVSAVRKNQAYIRGFLVRQTDEVSVRFCNFGLFACTKKLLGGHYYAIYAYFREERYRLEAVCKHPKARLQLILDSGLFKRFGVKIDRKKVFEDLIFPIVTIQVVDEATKLCIESLSALLQKDPQEYVKVASSPIRRRRVRKTKLKATVPIPERPEEDDASDSPRQLYSPTTQRDNTPLTPDSSQPRFPTVFRISPPTPIPDDCPLPPPLSTRSSLPKRQVRVSTPSIMRTTDIAIDPQRRSPSPLLVVESGHQSVIPTLSEARLSMKIEETETISIRNYAPSEPRSPASKSPEPQIPPQPVTGTPASSIRYREARKRREMESGRELITRVGVECTAGFFMVSMYWKVGEVVVQATDVESGEKVETVSDFSCTEFEEVDAHCNSLLASLDILRTDSGSLLLLTNGQSTSSQCLYTAEHNLNSRSYQISISSENHNLLIRAFDPINRKTLELALQTRTRRAESISQAEFATLAERLLVQIVLGREVLLLNAN